MVAESYFKNIWAGVVSALIKSWHYQTKSLACADTVRALSKVRVDSKE